MYNLYWIEVLLAVAVITYIGVQHYRNQKHKKA